MSDDFRLDRDLAFLADDDGDDLTTDREAQRARRHAQGLADLAAILRASLLRRRRLRSPRRARPSTTTARASTVGDDSGDDPAPSPDLVVAARERIQLLSGVTFPADTGAVVVGVDDVIHVVDRTTFEAAFASSPTVSAFVSSRPLGEIPIAVELAHGSHIVTIVSALFVAPLTRGGAS
jgi:hypothetical protein